MGRRDEDFQPRRLSELTEFTQQFLPLDTALYHPTENGVEKVLYKEYLRTDAPPANELYFSEQRAEKRVESIKAHKKEQKDE